MDHRGERVQDLPEESASVRRRPSWGCSTVQAERKAPGTPMTEMMRFWIGEVGSEGEQGKSEIKTDVAVGNIVRGLAEFGTAACKPEREYDQQAKQWRASTSVQIGQEAVIQRRRKPNNACETLFRLIKQNEKIEKRTPERNEQACRPRHLRRSKQRTHMLRPPLRLPP